VHVPGLAARRSVADHVFVFPVYWQQFTPATGPDWFNKWDVASVSVSDPTGGSAGTYTAWWTSRPAWLLSHTASTAPCQTWRLRQTGHAVAREWRQDEGTRSGVWP
jgi:hypothetical protein